jgi:hypothetical protein
VTRHLEAEATRPGACLWCGAPRPAGASRWCSTRCRQTAHRARRIASLEALGDTPMRLAYADPPYPGLAHRYYSGEPSYAGEVDHARLLERLSAYDGWALSTSRAALGAVLSLSTRVDGDAPIVCPWVKTHGIPRTRGPSCVHEYVLVQPARRRFPGVRDALVAAVAKGGDSDLIGRKPLKFVHWVIALLGASPCDSLDDLYPGSGVVGRVWAEWQRTSKADPSARVHSDDWHLEASSR